MRRNYNRDLYKHLEEALEQISSLKRELEEYRRRTEQELFECHARISELEVEGAQKDAIILKLQTDNERLKRIVNNDSGNSSLPPSSDQKPSRRVNAYNSRAKTERKVGGQLGHSGSTLTCEQVTELINSGACDHSLETYGVPGGSYVTRYIVDLTIRPVIRELRFFADETGKSTLPAELNSVVTYGNEVKALGLALMYVGNVPINRCKALISALSKQKLNISEASLYRFAEEFARRAEPFISEIKEELLSAEVLLTDATTVTVDGIQEYIRNQSTDSAVLYTPMRTKTLEEMAQCGVMNLFAGTYVHDHETALYHFGTAHAECNAHILRYLKRASEETNNPWCSEMSSLLLAMNKLKKESPSVIETQFSQFSKQYDEILKRARVQNSKHSQTFARSEERALIARLHKYKENHLLFALHPKVPFTNNMSERDLRKCKNRQKTSGGFRKQTGKQIYCTVLSLIETWKRKNLDVFGAIRTGFSHGRVIA